MTADVTPRCPACAVAVSPGDSFCGSCGAALATATRRPRRRQATASTPEQQARDRAEFARTKRIALYLRSLYWVNTAGVLAMLPFTLRDGESGEFTLMCVVMGAIAATMAAGALFVVRSPLVWSLVLAALETVNLALVWSDVGLVLPTFLPLLLTLVLWAAVLQAARLQRLMAADPDLQIVRRRIDPRRHVEGGVADTAQKRRRIAARKLWGARLRILGIAAAGLAAAVFGIVLLLRPEAPATAVARFRAAWLDGKPDAFLALCDSPGTAVALRTDLSRRGWSPAAPPLASARLDTTGSAAIATFGLADGELRTSWFLDRAQKRWLLGSYRLPPLQTPSPGPAAAEFRTAWSKAGTDAVFATLQDSLRTMRGASIRGILERRGWLEQRPPLAEAAVEDRGNGEARASYALGDGQLSLRLYYHHPRWWVAGINFPRDE